MLNDMKARRMAPKTQEAYIAAVAGFARYHNTSPETLTNSHIDSYLVHLLEERKLAWSSCNVALAGLRFFYEITLNRPDISCALPPRKKKLQLFEVLSPTEVERLIKSSKNAKHKALLMTTYACGMRVSEVVKLKVSDIDSERMMIHIRQGKGNKDRYVPLSEQLLVELREYWVIDRPQPFFFPSRDGKKTLSVSSAQNAYYSARMIAGITKGKGIHTLRHAFATHLLERGEDLRTIQELLGHRSLATTMVYLRVSRKKLGSVKSPLDLLNFNTDDRTRSHR
jgi:site-specific recombinase XerD